MNSRESIWNCEDARSAGRVRETLESAFGVVQEGSEPIRRGYHDTFDWRVLGGGGALVADESVRPSRLCWNRSDGTLLHGPIETAESFFARDLPPGSFRDALGKLTELRRIEKRVQLRARSSGMALTDAQGNIVLRLVQIVGSLRGVGVGAKRVRIKGQLRLRSLRGHEAQFDRALELIAEAHGELAPERDELSSLLRLLEIDPQQTRSRFRLALDPAMPAEAGVRRILRRLAQTMQLNTEGTRRNLDIEYLHDFRVALRRTRCCLGELRGVLEPHSVAPFADAFRQLGRITGVVRDLDVHQLQLPSYRGVLGAKKAHLLEPLGAWLRDAQQREQRRMARRLGSRAHRELMERWVALLENQSPGSSAVTTDGGRELGELARERVRRAHKRIVRRGSKLKAGTRAAKIHRLRIDCKKLRYLLEFFRALFDPRQLNAAVKELKKLQDVLGEFNDLDVQSTSLSGIADQLPTVGGSAADTLIAVRLLVERTRNRQRRLRARLIPRIRTFIGDDVRVRFKEMTRADRGKR